MAITPGLDYTDKDFDSLRARLFNLISSVHPEWTDREVANFGNMLVECFAFVGDVLGFYQDNQANEAFLPTAQLRSSLIALAKRTGYRPVGATAATTQLSFTLAEPPIGNVHVLAGDEFRTQKVTDPVVFQALAGATIPAGANPPSVVFDVEHSRNSSQTFQSTALPNQELLLGDVPFLDGSLVVIASDGPYAVVETFLESTALDRHVTVSVDASDRATLRFGNGVQGAIPQGLISCTYKTGGGVAGVVDPNTITRAEKTYTDDLGNPVRVTVTNAEKANGGRARQTVESIRVEAPRSLRALTRSVAREDYEIHALKVPAVARALMLTRNERPAIAENTGQLLIVPAGLGQPSQALKDAVLEQVTTTYPKTNTFAVSVLGPTYTTIDVTARVFPRFGAGSSAQNTVLGAQIRAALEAFFGLDATDPATGALAPNPNAHFGYYLDGIVAFSDVYNAVRDVANVRRIGDESADFLLNGAPEDVAVEPHAFPMLGTVSVINGFTGLPLAA